jgi:6-phosphogluconolactonase
VSVAVYVANADSQDISVLCLDTATGALTPLLQVAVGGAVMPLAVSPDRCRLYASIRSEPFEVLSFSIGPRDGRLALIGRHGLPASMCWIGTDRSGRFLLSASYAGSMIAVSPIDANGVAWPAQQTAMTAPNAHAVQADPSNRFLFAACLGGGVLLRYRFDALSGALEPDVASTWQARLGAGPRHFVFHPTAPFAYLLNELDAGIDVLAYDAARGILSVVQTIASLPPGFVGEPWAADIHLTPDARFLYTSERRSSTLAAFAVDADSGELSPIGQVPTEAQPRGFAIDPSGRWLLAAGQESHRVSLYAIDPASGRLVKHGERAVGRNPNWVEIVATDREASLLAGHDLSHPREHRRDDRYSQHRAGDGHQQQ